MEARDIGQMRPVELGRAMLDLGQTDYARDAFTLVLDDGESAPEEVLEAAVGLFQTGGDYRPAYDAFLRLHREGQFREETLSILTDAFYAPNLGDLRRRYQKNCALLSKYPYLFRRDFPAFDSLPLRFYPYDEGVYVPYDGEDFLPPVRPGEEIVRRNFFRDLGPPVRGDEVYSQYELAYLRDNVRRSEDVGKENHVYLCYENWEAFCAWLQILDFRPLLKEEKLVFLFGEDRKRYPLDFQKEFGVDYGRCPVKPLSIREVTRLIWHTQLSTHNGGDFFNEIFDGHPNLICLPSVFLSKTEESVRLGRTLLSKADSPAKARQLFRHWKNPALAEELYRMKRPRDKDFLVAAFLGQKGWNEALDPASRIAPALFFQPHFPSIRYQLKLAEGTDAVLTSEEADAIRNSPLFRDFPYIKTFTPIRRITTSYGASVRYMRTQGRELAAQRGAADVFPNAIVYRALNRSFLADPADRLFRDSVIVRFEDGKLNPKATFTALAAFLDLPYTESMTYCSSQGVRDPRTEDPAGAVGFDPAAIYKTYDGYVNDSERCFLEYCLRDAYAAFGYDFHWYDGQPMDRAAMEALINGFSTLDRNIREAWAETRGELEVMVDGKKRMVPADMPPEERGRILEQILEDYRQARSAIGRAMLLNLRFVTRDGVPLRHIPLLQIDPALLEQPVYH